MPLYTSPNYRVGMQGYLAYAPQAAAYCGPAVILDPAVVGSVNNFVGPCDNPGWQLSEGTRPVQGIGESLDVGVVDGRREFSMSTRLQIANAQILTQAIRAHTEPDVAGSVKGLPRLTIETGADAAFADADLAYQGLDALCNSLRIEYAENQPVQADMEFWPIARIPQPTPQSPWNTGGYPSGQILVWQHMTWSFGGTDYKNILSRASITLNNNLERVGSRAMLGVGASELNISRTPYAIVPKLESLQVQYTLYDQIPNAVTRNLGAVTLYAVQPGVGAGRNYLQVVITNNLLSQRSQTQGPANQMMMFSASTASYAIAITAGQT